MWEGCKSFMLGIIIASISTILLCISYTCKKKEKIFLIQCFECIFALLANLYYGGYSGAVSSSIALFRNVTIACKRFSKKIVVVCAGLQLLNIIFFAKSFIAVLPAIASLSFTIGSLSSKTQFIRAVSILSSSLWAIYSIGIGDCVTAFKNTIVVVSVIVTIFYYKSQNTED